MRGLLVAAALSVFAAAPVAGAEYFPVGQVFSPLAADPSARRSAWSSGGRAPSAAG
jgi:hypothetical protein